jgi:putative phosphoserine phosphatase/1-acylglycerol-3-phosphate O-acyltransferase
MYKTLVVAYRWILALGSMLIVGSVCLLIVLISFGYLRNFCNRYIFSYTSRFMLRLVGYGYELPPLNNFPKHQVLYTINHNSYLDTFILTAVGIPNVRFLLSEKTIKYVPMVIAAKAFGTWYIPQQFHVKRRLDFFIRKTAVLKKTNYSVIASAEGVHEHKHTIAPFNKGIFHMALEAGIPIVPLFIYTPEEANPYTGQYSKTGTIKLIIMDEIDNSNWKLETIRDEIDKVRNIYVAKFNELNHTNIT